MCIFRPVPGLVNPPSTHGCAPWAVIFRQAPGSVRSMLFAACRAVQILHLAPVGFRGPAAPRLPAVPIQLNSPLWPCACSHVSGRRKKMLWTICVILLVLWALGMVTSYTASGLIHILLVVALVILVLRLVQGRRIFN